MVCPHYSLKLNTIVAHNCLAQKKKKKIIDEDITIFVITVRVCYIKFKKIYIDSTLLTKSLAVYVGNTSYLFFFHSI